MVGKLRLWIRLLQAYTYQLNRETRTVNVRLMRAGMDRYRLIERNVYVTWTWSLLPKRIKGLNTSPKYVYFATFFTKMCGVQSEKWNHG